MLLSQLRELVENGRTAKWKLVPERSDRFYFIIRIKKVAEGFAWQHKMMKSDHTLVSTQTVLHPSWEMLYKDITGDGSSSDQTTSTGWTITDEDLDPFLPERRELPAE